MGQSVKRPAVFILTNTLKSGGAEKQSIYLTRVLKDNFDVTLIVYYGAQFDQRITALLEDATDKVLWLEGNHLKKFLKLYRLFRRNKNSVIFSYLATTNFINAIIGTLAGVKVKIGGIRNSKHPKNKLLIQKNLHNYFLTASVFNNAKGVRQLAQKGFKLDKSYLIYNGIDINIKPKSRNGRSQVNILTVSRFMPQKDFRTAFRAIAQLTKKHQEYCIKYYVVGYGPLESELKLYAKELGIDHCLAFIHNPSDVDTYYFKSDIYLTTSLYEGLSNSIMEAMLYSLPVVATDVGDNSVLVKNGESGYLLPVGDFIGISERIEELVKSLDLRHSLGINGYNHLRNNFSIEEMKKKYISLIEMLINEKKV